MVKAPALGRVKTRLAQELGAVAATRLFRTTVATLIMRLARDPRFDVTLAVTPDAAQASRALPPVPRCAQGRGDLGARMQRLLTEGSPGPIVLVGSDIPGIRAGDIAAAAHALGSADVVLGPAEDGGFWLVGYRRRPRPPRPFEGVRWSHSQTLADVRANLERSGARVALAPRHTDIDEARDVARLGPALGRLILPSR